MMRVYLVGGYVRDMYLRQELGYQVTLGDRDWVVVGATPKEMIEKGFKPVGKDFPVFLHPQTHEEYALARTERKVAPGYHGFIFHASEDVSLEQDLLRRDLTINAMALDGDNLIDPYGGLSDIRAKLLRHVSEAFKEDPVRILRIARFSAKLPEFTIATETKNLLKEMVQNGEADSLVPERVFLEMRKTLHTKAPSRFVVVLRSCGLWERLFKNFPIDHNVLELLDQSQNLTECEKFALLTHGEDNPSQIKTFLSTLKPPADIIDMVLLWNKVKNRVHTTNSDGLLSLIELCDALRRPERFKAVLNIAHAIYSIKTDLWEKAFERVQKVDAAKIAASCADKSTISQAIHLARLRAIKELI